VQHDADHGEADESGNGCGMAFEIASQSSIAADPCKGSFDDPALGQDDELVQFVAFDDFDDPAAGRRSRLGGAWTLISAVGENAFDEGKQGAGAGAEYQRGTVAILYIGRMDGNAQQKAERIDEDMALASGDFLARIIALRVHRGPPFCAVLALWLSMMAAVGLASRPACSRTAT